MGGGGGAGRKSSSLLVDVLTDAEANEGSLSSAEGVCVGEGIRVEWMGRLVGEVGDV